ncbi:hypothetical protein FEM03_15845 [Phragmitibacter flavus]|uniref:TNase-like domain-containing protein n=1 Tax=Phragmitibacter flavus TaxID=2576071 RepID=A0A5R8KBW3_9BACT|nr:hypothetical protein [Phragmitibacter flavus]TLD69796.1 hypothetical protein FEM03_15845 [Phragmitibacter flavus]
MQPRAAISNGIITIVVLFFMLMVGMLLKARYRLAANETSLTTVETTVPKAIPVAMAVEPEIHQPRAYQDGDWWVLPNPELVVSRANEADTMRIRSGVKEDVFVLYFVDATETSPTRLQRLREQSTYYHQAHPDQLLATGQDALKFVTQLLSDYPFTVYTKWGRVPDSERFYAIVRIEMIPGKTYDLGELLISHGYASPTGQQTGTLPSNMPALNQYLKNLSRALSSAKADQSGAWALSSSPSL